MPAFIELDAAALARIVGNYELKPGATIGGFLWDNRPFINVPGEGEAEMFAVSPLDFIIRVEPGVSIRFEADASGSVTGLVLKLGSQEMRARRP
ncbi:MAG: hypothetical protein ACT443_12305 [Gemmatimonadota bacterium]